MLGLEAELLAGSFPPQPGSDPAERAAVLDVAAAVRNGEGRVVDLDLTCGDGSTIRVSVMGCPISEPGGPRSEVAVVFVDRTRQRRLEQDLEASLRSLRDVAAATGNGIWIGDAAGDAEWVDPRLAQTVGQHAEDLIGRGFESLAPVALRGQFRAAFDGARRERAPRQIVAALVGPQDVEVPVTARFHPLADDAGRHRGMVVTISNSAPERRTDSTGTQTELLDVLGAAVVAVDGSGRINHWNEAARRLSGYKAAEAIGQPAVGLLLPDAPLSDNMARRDALVRNGQWQGEVTMRRKDGVAIPVYTHMVRPKTARGSLATVAVAIDMSEYRDTESRFEDARGYLSAVASSMAEALFALTPDGRVAFMNGVAEQMFGWRMQELKGRYLHSAIHYQRPDGSGFPAHECQIVRAARTGRTISVDEDAFTHRDGHMIPVEYTAAPIRTGRGSRGTVLVIRDVGARRADREQVDRELEGLTWVTRVREALDKDDLVLYAQPIVDLQSGAVVKHELLLRMTVDGDVVEPGVFLPLAERHGLIGDVDRWVIRRAAALAAAGSAVALNLSAKSIGDPALLSEVERVLGESGADPSKLIFEITETALLEDEQAARGFADAMKSLGCGFALDDFGTGYGGFTYLKRLPVQYLKIDIEFVRDLLEEESSVHVVKAVVALARSFGHKTIAEGVENEATVDRLRTLGVDFAQGYLLGAPAPVTEVLGR
jgi:PAS domain S-box-containing protein